MVPADKAKKIVGPANYWEISFKETYETLSDSIISVDVKKHVSSLNTFILNFCLISSSIATFEHPDGAPDINAYTSAGFPKTAHDPFYLAYTTKGEAKEWLEFITGAKASSYDELFTAAIAAADKLNGYADKLIVNTIRYLAPACVDLSKYITAKWSGFEDEQICLKRLPLIMESLKADFHGLYEHMQELLATGRACEIMAGAAREAWGHTSH